MWHDNDKTRSRAAPFWVIGQKAGGRIDCINWMRLKFNTNNLQMSLHAWGEDAQLVATNHECYHYLCFCCPCWLLNSLAGYTMLNRILPNQHLLYKNLLNCTQLNQETSKSYLAKPYFAMQESAKTRIRNVLSHTLLNRNLISHFVGICHTDIWLP